MANGSVPVDQVRILNYNNQDIGMGFNSDTGLSPGTALDFDLPSPIESSESQADVTIVTSHEELMSTLHMSADVEGRYAFSSGGMKVDFSKKTGYNSSSTFVVAHMVINNTIQRGKNFKVKSDLQNLLNTPDGVDTFNKAFGDAFVRAHIGGGEFYAVMRVTSVDSKTETDLSVTLQADVQGGVAGGSFNGKLDTANSDAKTQSEFSVQYYQKGGVGGEESGATLSVDEIKARLKAFPDAVKNHPFPYFIEVASYDTIPLPLGTKEQQEDFLLALADADSKKLDYLQKHNDCEFAFEHPEYFSDPPPKPQLLQASSTYLQLLNGAIAHAVRLSNGEINPPQFFDPSKLTPPITVPDLQLRKRDVGLETSFAQWWVDKDKPEMRKSDHDLVVDIANAAIPELSDFSSIVDPGGDPAKTAQLQAAAMAHVVASFQKYDWDHPGIHDAGRAKLQSLSALPTMLPATVKSLAFSGNAITDTRGLEAFATLVELDLSHNALASIAELGALGDLRTLSLVDNAISDVSPLANCTTLETLDLSGNDITDLTPLGSCKALTDLTLSGTVLFSNGVRSRSGNPIANAVALKDVPGLANPLVTGQVLAVRYGMLPDGPAAQFTGTATRIGNSCQFRVHLTRGADAVDDVWTLRAVRRVSPADYDSYAAFFPGVMPGDFPTSGAMLSIERASQGEQLEINMAFVDPNNPSKAGIDLDAFPAFGTKIRLPTFDAVVTA
jgi:hypothetical protein